MSGNPFKDANKLMVDIFEMRSERQEVRIKELELALFNAKQENSEDMTKLHDELDLVKKWRKTSSWEEIVAWMEKITEIEIEHNETIDNLVESLLEDLTHMERIENEGQEAISKIQEFCNDCPLETTDACARCSLYRIVKGRIKGES